MAITINRQPEQFQPTYTDGIFYTITSDKTSNLKYRFVYDVYVNDVNVFRGKTIPNPSNVGVVDISPILKNYAENSVEVNTDEYIHLTEKFTTFINNEVIDYYVRFGEEYSTGVTSNVVLYNGYDGVGNPAVPSDIQKAFNGTYPTNIYGNQQSLDISPYVLSGDPVQYSSGLFLTNSPRIIDISMNEYHTLSFTNYYLGGDLFSYAYQVEYVFYDSDGVALTSTTVNNITGNGGGPLTGFTSTMYDDGFIVSSARTYNVLNVASGPANIQSFMPANTQYYTVQLKGVNQSSSFGCPTGYRPGYIESCEWGYQLPICYPDTTEGSDPRYWPSGLSVWNADCFFLAASGGPGGELYTGGTSYDECVSCIDEHAPAEFPPNEAPGSGTPPSFSGISEIFQFNIESDCDRWNNKQMVWKNRYGTYDYYRFNQRKSEGLNIQRQTYVSDPVSWGSATPTKKTISRGLTDFNVAITESHVINTGFVNRATMVWLEECYTSPEVYLIENDGELFPINITSTEYIRKNRGNRELINLELTYTYSNNIRLL